MFSLLPRLFRCARALNPASPPRAERAPTTPTPHETVGCGWFDSSHDLLNGVTVWEGIIVVDNSVAHPT